MKLFDSLRRRPERKASRTGALVAAFSVGKPVWQERDFHKLAYEGYRRNVVVYACVWFTAKALADVPLKIMRNRGLSRGPVSIPALAALLDRPNPVDDGVGFRQAVASDYLLGGNAFMERVDVGGSPRELYRWRPDRARVVPGSNGLPQAYEFSNGAATRRVAVDLTDAADAPVLHWRDYNPTDDFYGMSPLDPAAFAVDSHTGAVAWNKALLDNGAQPSGALVYAPREGPDKLSEPQWERLRQELDQAFSGAANAGKPLLLDGGMDWKEMGLSPRDMNFVEGKNSSARDIALAIGVPPLLLGLPGDNTFSNYAEANKAFYRQTVLPLLSSLCRSWTWWLTQPFGQGLSIVPDVDALPVFADERAAAWSRVEGSSVLTVNEKRHALGFGPVAGGDVVLVPGTMVALGADPERKFRPDQLRVPAGNAGGGRWTDEGGARIADEIRPTPGDREREPRLDDRPNDEARIQLVSDDDKHPKPSFQLAPRLEDETSDLKDWVVNRILQSLLGLGAAPAAIAGSILALSTTPVAKDTLEEVDELAGRIGPGPYARGLTKAGPQARPTGGQQNDINQLGNQFGCHTCGAETPGTNIDNYVGDHQPPTSLNPPGGQQYYLPHCLRCASSQGGLISQFKKKYGIKGELNAMDLFEWGSVHMHRTAIGSTLGGHRRYEDFWN